MLAVLAVLAFAVLLVTVPRFVVVEHSLHGERHAHAERDQGERAEQRREEALALLEGALYRSFRDPAGGEEQQELRFRVLVLDLEQGSLAPRALRDVPGARSRGRPRRARRSESPASPLPSPRWRLARGSRAPSWSLRGGRRARGARPVSRRAPRRTRPEAARASALEVALPIAFAFRIGSGTAIPMVPTLAPSSRSYWASRLSVGAPAAFSRSDPRLGRLQLRRGRAHGRALVDLLQQRLERWWSPSGTSGPETRAGSFTGRPRSASSLERSASRWPSAGRGGSGVAAELKRGERNVELRHAAGLPPLERARHHALGVLSPSRGDAELLLVTQHERVLKQRLRQEPPRLEVERHLRFAELGVRRVLASALLASDLERPGERRRPGEGSATVLVEAETAGGAHHRIVERGHPRRADHGLRHADLRGVCSGFRRVRDELDGVRASQLATLCADRTGSEKRRAEREPPEEPLRGVLLLAIVDEVMLVLSRWARDNQFKKAAATRSTPRCSASRGLVEAT